MYACAFARHFLCPFQRVMFLRTVSHLGIIVELLKILYQALAAGGGRGYHALLSF